MLNCLGVTYTGSCCLHCASGGHTVDSSVSQQKYDVLKNLHKSEIEFGYGHVLLQVLSVVLCSVANCKYLY